MPFVSQKDDTEQNFLQRLLQVLGRIRLWMQWSPQSRWSNSLRFACFNHANFAILSPSMSWHVPASPFLNANLAKGKGDHPKRTQPHMRSGKQSLAMLILPGMPQEKPQFSRVIVVSRASDQRRTFRFFAHLSTDLGFSCPAQQDPGHLHSLHFLPPTFPSLLAFPV